MSVMKSLAIGASQAVVSSNALRMFLDYENQTAVPGHKNANLFLDHSKRIRVDDNAPLRSPDDTAMHAEDKVRTGSMPPKESFGGSTPVKRVRWQTQQDCSSHERPAFNVGDHVMVQMENGNQRVGTVAKKESEGSYSVALTSPTHDYTGTSFLHGTAEITVTLEFMIEKARRGASFLEFDEDGYISNVDTGCVEIIPQGSKQSQQLVGNDPNINYKQNLADDFNINDGWQIESITGFDEHGNQSFQVNVRDRQYFTFLGNETRGHGFRCKRHSNELMRFLRAQQPRPSNVHTLKITIDSFVKQSVDASRLTLIDPNQKKDIVTTDLERVRREPAFRKGQKVLFDKVFFHDYSKNENGTFAEQQLVLGDDIAVRSGVLDVDQDNVYTEKHHGQIVDCSKFYCHVKSTIDGSTDQEPIGNLELSTPFDDFVYEKMISSVRGFGSNWVSEACNAGRQRFMELSEDDGRKRFMAMIQKQGRANNQRFELFDAIRKWINIPEYLVFRRKMLLDLSENLLEDVPLSENSEWTKDVEWFIALPIATLAHEGSDDWVKFMRIFKSYEQLFSTYDYAGWDAYQKQLQIPYADELRVMIHSFSREDRLVLEYKIFASQMVQKWIDDSESVDFLDDAYETSATTEFEATIYDMFERVNQGVFMSEWIDVVNDYTIPLLMKLSRSAQRCLIAAFDEHPDELRQMLVLPEHLLFRQQQVLDAAGSEAIHFKHAFDQVPIAFMALKHDIIRDIPHYRNRNQKSQNFHDFIGNLKAFEGVFKLKAEGHCVLRHNFEGLAESDKDILREVSAPRLVKSYMRQIGMQ